MPEKIACTEIGTAALCKILGDYSIPTKRFERVLRESAEDMACMDCKAFEELVKVQLCLQRFRSIHRGPVTLSVMCNFCLQCVSPYLLLRVDVSTKLLEWLAVGAQLLSEDVGSAIGDLQIRWRVSLCGTLLYWFCCSASASLFFRKDS